MSSKGLKSKTLKGFKWSFIQQVITQILVLVTGIILMRLLSPKEFGIVAMVTVISSFLNIFSDFGLTSSLIRKKEIEEIDIQVVYTITVILGCSLAMILFICSNFLADFYKEPRVSLIAKILSLNFVFASITSIHTTLLRKNLRFKEIAISRGLSILIASTIAIYLAYENYGIWALVAQGIVSTLFYSLIISKFISAKFKFNLNKEILKEHLNFGVPLFGSRTFSYFSKNSDKIFIGKFLSSYELGIYSRAYNLVYLPIHKISMIFTSVMFSAYSKISNEKKKIGDTYLSMISILMYLLLIGLSVLFIYSDFLVVEVLGEKWIEISELMKVFVFVVTLQLPLNLRSNVTLSQGNSKHEFYFTIIGAILDITAIIIGLYFGLIYVAYGLLVSIIIKVLINCYLIKLSINLNIYSQIIQIAKPILGSLVFIFSFTYFSVSFTDLNKWILIFIALMLSIFFNSSILYLWDRKLFGEITLLISKDVLIRRNEK